MVTAEAASADVFAELESEVRSYCRAWPTVFTRAQGARIEDESGRSYIDFFAGAGALNYGHNPPQLIAALIDYLQSGGILHSLDMSTAAKRDFLLRFDELILAPRGMRYRVQFPGPTGANAVEAALKLARKVTGRRTVVSFTNAFHGMTLGALAVSANPFKREGAGVPLEYTATAPYDGQLNGQPGDADTIETLDAMLTDDPAAAVIVETVQGEGGLHAASDGWLQRLEECCRRHGALLIVDDIQAGCGRTGAFFSFEPAGVSPDIITLSKSISGLGLPLALTLIRPELDIWKPGEHNGTFRGNNAAFITATAALEHWRDDALTQALTQAVERKAASIRVELEAICAEQEQLRATPRGRGLLQGLHTPLPNLAEQIAAQAFNRGLLVETSGADADVVKLMPPLTIDDAELDRGLEILRASAAAALG